MKDEGPGEPGIRQGNKYLATGLRFGGGIVMFLLLGYAVDRWLNTVPLFLLIGTFVGAGLGFLSVWRELKADAANQPTWRKGAKAPGRKDGQAGGQADGRSGGQEP
jgi:F0F1-type ATP synthase assembly protein I